MGLATLVAHLNICICVLVFLYFCIFVFLYLYAINGWFAPTGSCDPSGSSESGQHRAELERVVAVSSSSMQHRQNCEN